MALSADKAFGVTVYNKANAEGKVAPVCHSHVMKACKESGNLFVLCFTIGEREFPITY
jgi:hypothetical protein